MKLEWSDTLSVGVDIIDAQHKGLFAVVNRLNQDIDELCALDSLTDKTKKMRIYMTILNLRAYFLEHFSTEERLMMKCRYPEFLEHKREHDMFIRKVLDFEGSFLEGNLSVAKRINDFLKMWIVGHLRKTDQKYKPHFRKHIKRNESPPEVLEDITDTADAAPVPEPEPGRESGPDQAQSAGASPGQPAEDKAIVVDVEKGLLEEHYKSRKKG